MKNSCCCFSITAVLNLENASILPIFNLEQQLFHQSKSSLLIFIVVEELIFYLRKHHNFRTDPGPLLRNISTDVDADIYQF